MTVLVDAALVPLPLSLPSSPVLESLDITNGPNGPETNIVNAWEMAMDQLQNNPQTVVEVDLSQATGLKPTNSIKLVVLPPGTRLHGVGLVWQNGYTYPFIAGDTGSWKAGEGAPFTIINDGGPGSDTLGLLVVRDQRHPNENQTHFPFPDDRDESLLWTEKIPIQNELGRHPAIPGIAADGTEYDVPAPKQGARPSNIQNGPGMTEGVGTGELYCEATSLTQDTGLSGKLFGVNFEIGPPGTRSSDAHAHSLEDELIFVLGGEGLVWINGHTFPVSTGDAVGFPAGTGDAHVFINDSNADDPLGGNDLALWIFGENRRVEGDKVFYPLGSTRAINRRWEDPPKKALGPHPGRPQRPAGLL